MESKINKYFVTKDGDGFSVIYQDRDSVAGNFWATAKDGFETESDATAYADSLNRNI